MLLRLKGISVLCMLLMSFTAFSGGFEKPTWIGARAMGMGGTGIAFDPTISAVYYNPAHFMFIETWAFGYDSGPTLTQVEADLSGLTNPADPNPATNTKLAGASLTGNVNEQSEMLLIPIFNIGGVFRFTSWLLFGVAVYSSAGLATRFENVGDAKVLLDVDFKVIEFAPFLVFEFVPQVFALALQYRALYGHYDQRYETTQPSKTVLVSHKNVDGFEWLGGRAGLSLNLGEIRLGLVVRSEIEADGFDGKTTFSVFDPTSATLFNVVNGDLEINDARLPWEVSGGAAYVAPNRAFVLAFDGGIKFYESNDVIDFDVKSGNAALASVNESLLDLVVHWHNSVFARLGGEVKIHDHYYVRMGWGALLHVTNKHFDSPLLTVPEHGMNYGFGFGFRGEYFVFDFGFDCNFANAKGQFSPPFTGATSAGRDLKYRTHKGYSYTFGFSMTYYGAGAPG